jgi:hypothetical protein
MFFLLFCAIASPGQVPETKTSSTPATVTGKACVTKRDRPSLIHDTTDVECFETQSVSRTTTVDVIPSPDHPIDATEVFKNGRPNLRGCTSCEVTTATRSRTVTKTSEKVVFKVPSIVNQVIRAQKPITVEASQ